MASRQILMQIELLRRRERAELPPVKANSSRSSWGTREERVRVINHTSAVRYVAIHSLIGGVTVADERLIPLAF